MRIITLNPGDKIPEGFLIQDPVAIGGQIRHYTHAEALRLIYKHTHKDYKGKVDGERTILMLRKGVGTVIVCMSQLTDEEIQDGLVYADRKERQASLHG